MKNIFLGVVLVISLLTLYSLLRICICEICYEKELRRKQQKLAEKLGIDLKKYDPDLFPSDYYAEILWIGMTKKEVQEHINGYLKICNFGRQDLQELYTYFYEKPEKSIQFNLIYTEDGELVDLLMEEPKKSSIKTTHCEFNSTLHHEH